MADGLRVAGHEAAHLRDLGLSSADDETVFAIAAEQHRVILSQDTDFGGILAAREAVLPSIVLFRRRQKSTDALLPLLLNVLPNFQADLDAGAVVVIEDSRIRIRALPLAGRRE
ncbi:MAG: DUF5615 family PIN-like protein [Phycisphaerae bacterium]|nr:DUF5615 family PIN-like protein [Phycisphaerae bacterium]